MWITWITLWVTVEKRGFLWKYDVMTCPRDVTLMLKNYISRTLTHEYRIH